MDWPSQSANKQIRTYSYRYIKQFHIVSITATASLISLFVFKTVTMPSPTTKHNFTFLVLVAVIQNWVHTHYNRSYMNPIQVYTAYNLHTVTPQPEGPTNTLTNCICTSCFYITGCLNIVIISVLCQLQDLNSAWQTNLILCFVT